MNENDEIRRDEPSGPSVPECPSAQPLPQPVEPDGQLFSAKEGQRSKDDTESPNPPEVGRDSRTETRKEPMLTVEYKHSLATRWMHWINFPLLFLMIYSGILIY